MAKRKNTKASKDESYQNLNDDEPMKGTRSTRSSGRNKRKNKKQQNYASTDDYKLRNSLEADGLTIVDMNADGNCLFRALSDQLYDDYGNRHDEVRSDVCDFMEENEDEFKLFLVFEDDGEEEEDAKDFDSYISNMRQDGEWGGNLELVAAARLYQRKITVFSVTLAAFTIEHGDSDSSGPDLLVCFHDNDHYNSVRNNEPPPNLGPKQKSPKKKSKADSSVEKSNATKSKEKKDTTLSPTTSMSELAVEDKKAPEKSQKPTKKSEPCPCGSSLRYKKCCFAKEKHAARVQKLKEANAAKNGDCAYEEDNDEDVVMKGNFRVLQI